MPMEAAWAFLKAAGRAGPVGGSATRTSQTHGPSAPRSLDEPWRRVREAGGVRDQLPMMYDSPGEEDTQSRAGEEYQREKEMEAMWQTLQNRGPPRAEQIYPTGSYPTNVGVRLTGGATGRQEERKKNPYPLRRVQGTVQSEPGNYGRGLASL